MRAFFNISTKSFKATIILFYILVASPIAGQKTTENCNNNVSDNSIYEEPLVGEIFTFNEFYLGKNYFNDKWLAGSITLESGFIVYNKILNYHLITQQLVWKRTSDKIPINIDRAIVKEFIIKSDSGQESLFRKTKIQLWGKTDSSELFLQVLSQGYFNLFANRKAVVGKNSETAYPVSEYYYNIAKGSNQRLKLSRASLYSVVKENKPIMKKIVKSNHLKIRRESGLIRAINLFNKEMGL